jgi:hypothetical protein
VERSGVAGKGASLLSIGALVLKGAMLEVLLYEQKRRRYSAFAGACCCAVLMKLSVLSSAVYVFFLSETLHSCPGVAVLRGEA